MTWALINDGSAVVNLDKVASLAVRNTGTDEYKLGVITSLEGDWNTVTVDVYLNGVWPTLAAAEEAARELTGAVDSATYGD